MFLFIMALIFSLRYSLGGETTTPIPCDANASEMKKILQDLNSVGEITVSRSEITVIGGYTWTISFLEDLVHTHHGDVTEMQVVSNLFGGSGWEPTATVEEVRKGTWKEVQRISVSAGGLGVDPLSSFRLEFLGQATSDILALPLGGTTCLGSNAAKQLIRTSTEDTSTGGGDDTVSLFTTFTITYKDFVTDPISAHVDSCANIASIIAEKLSMIPPLNRVEVSGKPTDAGDNGCEWEITLLSVTGHPELLQGKKTDVNYNPGEFYVS